MYGECGDSYTGKLNCPYYGPPKPLKDQKAVETLKRFCPYLVKGRYNYNYKSKLYASITVSKVRFETVEEIHGKHKVQRPEKIHTLRLVNELQM